MVDRFGGVPLDQVTGTTTDRFGGAELEDVPVQRSVLLEQLAAEQGPFESAMISAGRTVTEMGRMVGLAEPEDPIVTEAIRELERQRPISTTVGQALPFVAPGVGVGAIPGTLARVTAGGALGAAEGGIVAAAGDQDVIAGAGIGGVIGAGLEAIFPVLGRLASATFRRITGRTPRSTLVTPDGQPTSELVDALQEQGLKFEDLVVESQQQIARQARGADPSEVARGAVLREIDAPATLGDIRGAAERGGFEQQALEARLVESTDPLGDPLRGLRLEQSRSFSNVLQQNIDELGVPEDVGRSIKDALEGRSTLLRTQKNDLYKQAAEQSEDLGGLPIFTDDLIDALPDQRTMRRLERRAGSQIPALNDLLVEFGVNKDSAATQAFLDAGGEIEPLSLRNFEDFRQELNALSRGDQSGATSVATGPLTKALDDELDNVFSSAEAGGAAPELLETLKEARKVTTELKTEFSPQSISGRLIDKKIDRRTPLIEASKVYDELLTGKRPPEFLDRTLANLEKSGARGEKAIGNLQAAAILDLLDNAFKASSRKIQGQRVFGQAAFERRLQQVSEGGKLDRLFKNNPKALADIRKVQTAAEIVTPPATAVPKGSGSILLDSLRQIGVMSLTQKLPGLGPAIANVITTSLEKGGNRVALERALNATPRSRIAASTIQRDFPSMAAALGISGLSIKERTEEQQ